MPAPNISRETTTKEFSWKRLFVKAAGFGAGVTLMLCLIAALSIWYVSRPEPPKPWNATALVAKDPPSFTSRRTGNTKDVEFTYLIENKTPSDYELASDGDVRITVKDKKGVFIATKFPNDEASLQLPIFIPAKQKAYVTLSIKNVTELPDQAAGESPEAYHERMRTFLEKWTGVGSFVLFDDSKRYQIELPRWPSEAPPKDTAGKKQ